MNQKKPEITWSLMHPTPLDVNYMQRVLAEADNYTVDSFEICASCHTLLGGLGGLVTFDDYPSVAATLDRAGIADTQQKLRTIVDLAHQSGRPVYYWHREATVWPELLKVMPDLMDKNGEFDLLGAAYEKLLRYKIVHAFAAVPQLDGLVLTLTEADFSTIHNSTPEIYPPEQVVNHLVRIFAEELAKLDKRFILRSFGSIAQDYEDILRGAELAANDFSFEVETKITPYDFNPFLPDNPFMRPIEHLTMGAECDSLGEFLGAGFLPAENVDNIVRYVRFGQKCGVARFAIRLDRIGNNIFDCYPINLYAYQEAILHPELTASDIKKNYAQKFYPAAAQSALLQLGELGYETVIKTQYIDHQLIFHGFPPTGDWKWIKAGGVLAVFQPGQSLAAHTGIWSILTDKVTPSREFIVAEKQQAMASAQQGLAQVEALQSALPPAEYQRLKRLWSNAVVASTALSGLVETICAYLDDMEHERAEAPSLQRAVDAMAQKLTPLLKTPVTIEVSPQEFCNGMGHSNYGTEASDLDDVYLKPLLALAQLLVTEYHSDFAAREELRTLPGVLDFVVPGAVPDEGRCIRFMHACHASMHHDRLGRWIGNPVFPNGFVQFALRGDAHAPLTLQLWGEGNCLIEANDKRFIRDLSEAPKIEIPAAAEVKLVLHKSGATYPLIQKVALCRRTVEF